MTTIDDIPDPADLLARGVSRLLRHLGYVGIPEFSLRSGRRADVAALSTKGEMIIVEIKRSVADFRSDNKWPEYRDYCDYLYFAVPQGFPIDILPDDCGLILADRYGAEIIRPAPKVEPRMHASRRKEVTLRFALAAGKRLRQLYDPELAKIESDEE